MSTPTLVEHFFRHEYGRLVATLSRRVGVEHLETVEDAVQTALLAALDAWVTKAVPKNPGAWLFRVAHNALIGELRKQSGRQRILAQSGDVTETVAEVVDVTLSGEVRDDLLRMLFVCCDDDIPRESQLVLALKTLCGFSVREIALRLFTSEANVYKRLGRARGRLRAQPTRLGELGGSEFAPRLPSVCSILYLLFTEGYLASHREFSIRRELCDEAVRLGTLLAEHPLGDSPQTFALVALMHLHRARMNARQDESKGLLLLEEQDRQQWDRSEIATGLSWLAKSATGEVFSRYHAEAGIAAEHCLAPSFAETRWDRVIECYELLEQVAPSAIHRLNRAVAVAEYHGPASGLEVIESMQPPTWLEGSYLWAAVAADLHRRAGNSEPAMRSRSAAIARAPSEAIRALLVRRLSGGS